MPNLGLVRRTAIFFLKQELSKIRKPRKMFRSTLMLEYLERLLRVNMVI